jgi:UDP-N-acetyl-D-mannosaminuronic acid transferase (WecB/TagA/CpsF family)
MEWLYRLMGNPKRLARRYLYDAFKFPEIFWNEWKSVRADVR